ncbi:type IV toxin-antitoxin system AbiEi family antitoxin domain-containing protein [Demequina maris]|uniref:type IV toxin-antitoxin system AbiEi family antitoxin domain-containing protein n=1 Tax=Demequina maris TaxID=1638982 RepID=UPI00078530B4|nr:type IV toxin-antitoxin system AbiEi family antitoxin domain-containing protein [Demequina maris]
MDPVSLVTVNGDVMRRADAIAAGVSRPAIARALAGGELIAPAHGVLALPTVSPAALAAASARARLTCVSAVAQAGLPVMGRPRLTHVATSTRGHGPQAHGALRVHFANEVGRSLAPMPVAAALDHAGRCVGERAHLVMLDAALRAGLVKGGDLASWTATGGRRRSWLLEHCDPRAESAQETLARIDLVEGGLRAVPQVYVDGVGRVDLMVEGVLALEIDGRGYHDGDDAFTRDRRRDRTMLRGGVPTARFTAAEIERARRGELAREVRGILGALGQRVQADRNAGGSAPRPQFGSL